MRNLKINFINDKSEVKYHIPAVPKGSQAYFIHFYNKIKKQMPKFKLIKNYPNIN
jgi:hypothetical protein